MNFNITQSNNQTVSFQFQNLFYLIVVVFDSVFGILGINIGFNRS